MSSSAQAIPASGLFDLRGAVAVVTGGGTGIGAFSARALASQGAKVYITGRRLEVLEATAKHNNAALEKLGNGGQLIPLQLDVADKASRKEAVGRVTKEAGKLHILINNAGVEGPTTFLSTEELHAKSSEVDRAQYIKEKHLFGQETEATWSNCFTTNVSALFMVSLAFLPLMMKGNASPPTAKADKINALDRWTASIINITSISGSVKLCQNHFAYNASKAAANHLTQLMATEFQFGGGLGEKAANLGVRVNAIAPGLVPTEMTTKKESISTGGQSSVDDIDASMVNPAGRTGTEEDFAQSVLYFACCGFVNGQVLNVDGGFLLAAPSAR